MQHLCNSSDFQRVYRGGRRFEGSLMTVFVLPNQLSDHRLGITASKKALGKAVQRNRAKRLLRETFRLKAASLEKIEAKYDWVLNAKRQLLEGKIEVALEEFESLVLGVVGEEDGVVGSRVA